MPDASLDPVLLAFVLDVQDFRLTQIKEELVKALDGMEFDDLALLYQPDIADVHPHKGMIVNQIIEYTPPQVFDVGKAIYTTLRACAEEDDDILKYVFVLTDAFADNKRHQIKTALTKWRMDNLEVFVLGIGKRYQKKTLQELAANYGLQLIHFETVEGVGDYIYNSYMTEDKKAVADIAKRMKEQIDGDGETCQYQEG